MVGGRGPGGKRDRGWKGGQGPVLPSPRQAADAEQLHSKLVLVLVLVMVLVLVLTKMFLRGRVDRFPLFPILECLVMMVMVVSRLILTMLRLQWQGC